MAATVVSVQPNLGDEWVGDFAFGDVPMRGVNAVLSMPNPRQLCVIQIGDYAGGDVPAILGSSVPRLIKV